MLSTTTRLTLNTIKQQQQIIGLLNQSSFTIRSFATKSAKPKKAKEEVVKEDVDNTEYGASTLKLTSGKKAIVKKVNKKKLLKTRSNPIDKTDTTTVLLTRLHPTTTTQQAVTPSVPSLKYDELKQLLTGDNATFTLVDLRDPKEFYGDSPIKQSQNLPMEYEIKKTESEEANEQKQKQKQKGKKKVKTEEKKSTLVDDSNFWQRCCKLTSAQWKDKYGFPKLQQSDRIIFYSANNGRSSLAAEMAISSGFNNVQILEGGIRYWNKLENKQ